MIRRILVLVAVGCLLGACSSNETPADGNSPEVTPAMESGRAPEPAGGTESPADSADAEVGGNASVEDASIAGTGVAHMPSEDQADGTGSGVGDTDDAPSIGESTSDESATGDESPDMVPSSGLRILRAYVCKGIEQSEPTEAGKSFVPEDGVLRLCCFSEIAGATGPDTILHIWRWGDREMARVVLEVKSDRWRTWSTKRILDEWRGEWRVDIAESDGTVLTSLEFSVE
jgi:hypothetical protein